MSSFKAKILAGDAPDPAWDYIRSPNHHSTDYERKKMFL